MLYNRFFGIAGAAWVEATTIRDERGNEVLVKENGQDKKVCPYSM
jgi:hypothetical protein